jgi:electron transport complex protein RnfG
MKQGKGFMGDALKLFIITLVAGVCLGAAYELTKDPIALAKADAAQKAYHTVFTEAASFDENADAKAEIAGTKDQIAKDYSSARIVSVMDAKDASGKVVGHVINSTGKGFKGDVAITVGIKSDGTVTGIGFLSISESPGLGMEAEKSDFYGQYENKKVDKFTVTKTGAKQDSDINAISGATITSRAVTNAVNAALYFSKNCIKQ